MSVGKDTLSQNRTGGKRGGGDDGARMGDGWWITRLCEGMGEGKPSRTNRVGCPQKCGA